MTDKKKQPYLDDDAFSNLESVVIYVIYLTNDVTRIQFNLQ